MIQLTCGACGEVQAFAEADIPPGSKTVVCQSCKSRIPVPNKNASTVLGLGGSGPTPSSPSIAIPSAALPDLPAPRRPSPLAGADLPAPKLAKPTLNDVSPPPPLAGPKTLTSIPDHLKVSMSSLADAKSTHNDLAPPPPNKSTVADLPAPKLDSSNPASQSRPGFGAPPPASQSRSGFGSTRLDGSAQDLPAPKRAASGAVPAIPVPAAPPPPTPPPLPVPPTTSSQPDLLAPKRKPEPMTASRPPPANAAVKATTTGLPPTRHPAMAPLAPAPPSAKPPPIPGKPGGGDIDLDDLLAPAATAKGLPDLPSPKRGGGPAIPDLPQPKAGAGLLDLPQPKSAAGSDMLQPVARGKTDLPAPKGFFEDLPQPGQKKGATDLPAPKGFFEDLPQPSSGPKAGATELPAPKGFFEDLPTRAKNQSGLPQPAHGQSGLPAPAQQGLAPAQQGLAVAATARGHAPSVPPSADDLFNDLTPPPTTSDSLDLDDLDLGGGAGTLQGRAKAGSAAPPPAGSGASISGMKPATVPPPANGSGPVPMLDLGDGGAGFANVDLPSTPAPGGGVSFKPAKPGSGPGGSGGHAAFHGAPATAELTLDVEDVKPKRAKRPSTKKQKAAERAEPAKKRSPVMMLVLLAVAGAGAGGFYWYRGYSAKQDRAAEAAAHLATARQELVAGRWGRAEAAGRQAIDGGEKSADAYGIAAQGALAGALDEGTNVERRIKGGSMLVNQALEAAATSPELQKAQGLKSITDGKAKIALDRLGKVPANDANGQLYLGWAKHLAADYAGAIEAFDRSAKALPKRDLPAIYGRARAKLASGDRAGAKADFALVLERSKNHVGAQVGLAAAAITPAEIAAREKDLLALLALKEIDAADQRAVAEAWTLAGDDASRASRTDAARERYRKALQKDPLMIPALRGLAEIELREGKLDPATDVVTKALKIAPDDVDINLVAAELSLRAQNFADAEGKVNGLLERKPPITDPAQKAKLFLVAAKVHEAQGRYEDALAACDDAIATAGPDDLAVPLAAATLLGRIADKTPDKADQLRERADKMLDPLAERAKKDPGVAVQLGIGYLAAGGPGKAETWLRQAIAARPTDIDAHFQLAESLSRQAKRDEALAILRKAYDLDPARTDVGLQLARRYEEAGRLEDAGAMYDGLLAGKDVTIDIRGRAGRYFARINKIDKARAQADEILAADPRNAAGLFLRGMGLMADDKFEEAKRRFKEAVELDPDPQYHWALGWSLERMYHKDKEPRFRDEAIEAYTEATSKEPDNINALLGLGRMQIERRDSTGGEKALVPLMQANKIRPNDADTENLIGIASHFARKYDDAIAWQERSLSKKRRMSAFLNVGTLYYDSDRFRQAAVHLNDAIIEAEKEIKAGGSAPDWLTDAYYKLGVSHENLGNGQAKCRAWRHYIDRSPKDQVKADKIKQVLLTQCR
jgi:tetratricopeptide (TPR) repeat protein